MFSPPPEICALILRYIATSRRPELLALLKTSKAFHAATEPIFYSYVIFTNVHRVQLFAHTIYTIPRLAAHVKSFGINLQELRPHSTHPTDARFIELVMQREFWIRIRRALECMSSLQVLVLAQMQGVKMDLTFVLDAPFTFRLREVKLHIAFDHHVAVFLRSQSTLRIVQIYAYDGPITTPTTTTSNSTQDEILPISLPSLTQFDGSLSVARYILSPPPSPPPLTHLQLLIDTPTTPLFPTLSLLSSTLRGLSLLDVPETISTPLLTLLAQSHIFPDSLLHISHFHLPFPAPAHSPERVDFLGALIKLRRLRSIEVTLNAWEFEPISPLQQQQKVGPGVGLQTQNQNRDQNQNQNQNQSNNDPTPSSAAQKALATEMKTYCPTLRIIVFWMGKTRFKWSFIADGLPMHNPAADEDGLSFESDQLSQQEGRFGFYGGDGNGNGGGSGRLENAAVGGEWHHRTDMNQWPALSNLWYTC